MACDDAGIAQFLPQLLFVSIGREEAGVALRGHGRRRYAGRAAISASASSTKPAPQRLRVT